MQESKDQVKNFKFKDFGLLKIRKDFYKYASPPISLGDEIVKHISSSDALKILDVGCGNGDLLRKIRLVKSNSELIGVDFSEGIIKTAKKNNSDIKFLVEDIEDLPFEDNSFDIIIAKHIFHLVPNVQKGIDEIYRCLKPGGKFIGVFHSKNNKPMLQLIQVKINTKFGVNVKHSDKNVTINDIDQYLKKFEIIKKEIYENKTELKESKPYVDYFASLKWSWVPKITEIQWEEALNIVEEFVDNEIAEKGIFTEVNSNGLVVAKKN